MSKGWIALDLDGTLARVDVPRVPEELGDPVPPIGPPVPAMLSRLRGWIARGETVKIFTGRACVPGGIEEVQRWLVSHGLPLLEVTNAKDRGTMEIWDDRAVGVELNTGERL